MTLEDLKSAEQLVKKKQQQENQQRTSELQQLVNNSSSGGVGSTAVGTTATVTAASAASAASDPTGGGQERRPSWRLKVDPSEKNRVSARIAERNVVQKMAMRLEVSPKREGCILFIFFFNSLGAES